MAREGVAQIVYDPNNGFLVSRLSQAAPVIGSTTTLPPFPSTGLGFAGAPSSYTGAGLSNLTSLLPSGLAFPTGLGSVSGIGLPTGPGALLGAEISPGAGPVPAAPVAPGTTVSPGPSLARGGGPAAGAQPVVPSRLVGGNPLLPSIEPGATPIQTGDDRAPWLIVNPSIRVSQAFDDNPRQSPSRFADSMTELAPGLILSADGPRAKALVSGTFDYTKYARATDQDKMTASGTGYGFLVVSPEHLLLDGRAAILQVSNAGGIGFGNPALVPAGQQSSILTTSVTPILRESFGLVDADFRYNHSSVAPLALSSSSGPGSVASALAATDTNEGTATLALGRGGGALASRIVLDASDTASQSTAASTQVRGYGDVQYRINPEIAVTGRIGYNDIRYSVARLAFVGPIFVAGTRLDLTPGSAVLLRYGRQDGVTGFSGGAIEQLGPRTLLQLSIDTGLSSREEQIAANLNASRLDIYGNVVDVETGLPLALANPEFGYNNTGVFRTQRARFALSHEFETDSLRLFVLYDRMTALAPPAVGDIARGIQISWFRSMTSRLAGAVSLGYATHSGGNTLTSSAVLTYNLREGIDATLTYQFQSQAGTGLNASYLRNIVSAGLRAAF